jgi:CRP-like cAMP-binding protein
MEDLDFVTAPEKKLVYDPAVARAFFQACGTPLKAVKGTTLFAAQSPGDKMYYIAAGEVAISLNGKNIDVSPAGEIIGEMSTIAGTPRSATAVARTDCMLIGLTREQFFSTLQQQPEFALMLMRMMLARLRLALSMLRMRGGVAGNDAEKTARILDGKLLKAIAASISPNARSRFPKDRAIIVEGGTGNCMYVVVEGNVSITIKGRAVEAVGVGGIFGEMALVDDAPRAAAVTAASDCTLLAIDRAAFVELVKSNPAFGSELLTNISERLRYLNAQRK